MGIHFIDWSPFKGATKGYHSCFTLRDEQTQHRLTQHLALHMIELPRFKRTVEQLDTDEERWLYFLRHGDSLTTEQANSMGKDIQHAEAKLARISQEENLRILNEIRMKQERDRFSYASSLRIDLEKEVREEVAKEIREEVTKEVEKEVRDTIGKELELVQNEVGQAQREAQQAQNEAQQAQYKVEKAQHDAELAKKEAERVLNALKASLAQVYAARFGAIPNAIEAKLEQTHGLDLLQSWVVLFATSDAETLERTVLS